MRSRVVTALVVTAAGLTVSAALRRFRGRRAATPAAPVSAAPAPVAPPADRDAVILAFPRPAAAPQPSAPARCGDSGGRTKAGAPCAARAAAGGRCHHHRLAA